MWTVASSVLVLAASANAAYQGFNYGSTFNDGRPKSQADFEAEFTTAASLDGTNGGFTSARLYTMIQAGSGQDPISAIPAAIGTGTSLLLGLWCSAGDGIFADELAALTKAIETYGEDFASLVAGISVGSEDLYRITATAHENGEPNPGASPATIASYIQRTREAISGTVLAGAKIGHVDTWTVWANSSNQAVIDAVDWVGMDAYPYFEKERANEVSNGKELFDRAIANTNAGTGGKELWVTETGWPVTGKTIGDAVPGTENAKTFWDEVGCPMFGVTNVWWYTFQDASPNVQETAFGVLGSELTTKPLYDLSCKVTEPTTETSTTSKSTSTAPSTTATPAETDEEAQSSAATPSGSTSGDDVNEVTNSADSVTATQTTLVPTLAPTPGSDTGSPYPGNGTDSGSGSGLGSGNGTSSGSDDGYVDASNAVSLGGSFAAVVLAIMVAVVVL